MEHRTLRAAATLAAAAAITAALAASASAAESTGRPTAPFAPHPLRCIVTADNVNYRRGPGTQFPSLGQLPDGFTFDSDGETTNPLNTYGGFYDGWENVIHPGYPMGYINNQFIWCVFT